ncbi:MAG: hypothetical protein JOY54_13905 [Acidobacteriaceae bacterium]|nr:hypothetical protein [Acidobacteriaceae bacterium]
MLGYFNSAWKICVVGFGYAILLHAQEIRAQSGAAIAPLPVFSADNLLRQPVNTVDSATPPDPGQTKAPEPKGTELPHTASAPPFTVWDKFDYRVVQAFGARGFVGAAVSAAIGQGMNSPHEWGQGAEGFGKRYGSGFAGNLSRQTSEFVLESALHEDPRYFPSEDKGTKHRILNAAKQVVFCKKDDGGSSFAYARVISAFSNGQFINLWQPESTGSVGDGFKRAFISLGGDFGYYMMQEFIPFTRPRSLRHRH